MARPFPSHIKDAIRELVAEGVARPREIQRRLADRGIRAGHIGIARYAAACERDRRRDDAERAEPRKWKEDGDAASLQYCTDHKVRTLEDAIKYAEVDLTTWRVKSWEATSWEVEMKVREESAGPDGKRAVAEKPAKRHLWRVWMRLERVAPKRDLDAIGALFDRLADRAPRYLTPRLPAGKVPDILAEFDLFDCHFANLSWAPESGENDDLRIKEAIFANAIDDILAKTRSYPIGEVIFPVGNDLHHVDTLLRTTTAGTPQDADGRYAKMIEVTQAAVIGAIERILATPGIRKVKVIYVPGNHDKLTSYHLCLTLDAWFRRCDRVEVDTTFCIRKYLRYARCLFGYTHGDRTPDGKLKELPLLMAHERRADWSEVSCCEIKTGHVHTSQTFTTLASKEFHGVMIRRLRSLTGPNAYHFDHGYIGNSRGAEGYLYDPIGQGYVGHFVAPVRNRG